MGLRQALRTGGKEDGDAGNAEPRASEISTANDDRDGSGEAAGRIDEGDGDAVESNSVPDTDKREP